MKKAAGIAAAALAFTVLLSGCGTSNETPGEGEKTEQSTKDPVLSINETPTPERINFTIDPGKVKMGTTIRVAAYGGGYDNKNPGCDGAEVAGMDMVINGTEPVKGSLNAPGAGIFRLVMTMPGFVTPCTSEAEVLNVKWNPQFTIDALNKVNGVASAKVKTVKPGEEFTISVNSDIVGRESFTGNFWQPMNITAHGPYANLPELQAAGCPADSPTAATLATKYNYAKAGTSKTPNLAFTLKAPGVYWFAAKVEGGDQVHEATATSCTSDVTKSVVIVE